MKRKIFSLMLCIILLVGTISFISAEILVTPEEVPFSLSSWFKHVFNIQEFSVCGQDRGCDVYARKTLYFYPKDQNVLMDIKASSYCSSGYGLIDLFKNDFAHPLYEFKDEMRYYCSYTYDKCIVEVYCCDHDECYKDSQCEDWEGPGSECKISYEDDPYIDYAFSSYGYCTPECTGSDITCWREENGVCVSRTYNCGYDTYPDCPTSYPYTSKSKCEGSLPEPEPEPECKTEADTNCDGNVDRNELGIYINKWINNQITRTKFGEIIQAWSESPIQL